MLVPTIWVVYRMYNRYTSASLFVWSVVQTLVGGYVTSCIALYIRCMYIVRTIFFGAPCMFLGVGCKVYIEYRTFRRLAWYCGCDRRCPVPSRWGRWRGLIPCVRRILRRLFWKSALLVGVWRFGSMFVVPVCVLDCLRWLLVYLRWTGHFIIALCKYQHVLSYLYCNKIVFEIH